MAFAVSGSVVKQRLPGSSFSDLIPFVSIKITKEREATELGRRKRSPSMPPASGKMRQEQTHPGMVCMLGAVSCEWRGFDKTPFFIAVLRKI